MINDKGIRKKNSSLNGWAIKRGRGVKSRPLRKNKPFFFDFIAI